MLRTCRGLIAHYLQVKIREHIILHGDVRTKVEKTVAGHTFEVEGFRDEDDDGAEEVTDSKLDRRQSFQLIAARLEKKGENVKLGRGHSDDGGEEAEMGMKNPAMGAMPLNSMASMPGIGAPGQMDPQQQMQMMMQMMQQQQMGGMGQMGGMPQQNMMGGMPHQNSMGGMQQQQSPGMGGMPMMGMGGGTTPTGQMSPGQMSPGGSMQMGQMGGMQPMQNFYGQQM